MRAIALRDPDLADPVNDFVRLANRIDNVEAKVDQLQATLTAILDKFDSIAEQVSPLIDKISNHPMLKMMGLNK